jgi:KDO2-lipid IV(A) lauroyltransferase
MGRGWYHRPPLLQSAAVSKRKQRAKIYSPTVWPTWFVLGCAWLVARLPLPLITALGQFAGTAIYRLGGSRRHITDVNIGLCFPDLPVAERQQLARRSMIHTAIGALEITIPWLNPHRDLSDRITVHGKEHLQAALALGRGVVLVGGHFSAMDIISQGLSKAVDIDVMYRENRNPVWEWLQVRGRQKYFAAVIEREDVRRTLQRLKSGHAVWYAADQDYGPKHSVFAPFFGVPTATISATSRLARFNASPVVFMSNFRDLGTLTWSVHFSPAIRDYPSDDNTADAARMNAIIEEEVRKHPDQYLWMHRRFKTRPPGESSFY